MKYCTKCLTTKEFSEFGKKKETKDGYRYCCKKCAAKIETEKRRNDKDIRAKSNEHAKNYRERKKNSDSYEEYKSKNMEMCKRYYLNNNEKMKEYAKKWREKNKEQKRFSNTMRKKYIKQQTPQWSNIQAIKNIYILCPDGMHVDHIIPLRGKTVSGLHVSNNLQYLPPDVNNSKKNSFDQESFTIIF